MARVVVLAEGRLGTDAGKTAHGLILHAVRDQVVAVIDARHAGADAGEVAFGQPIGIPVVADLDAALAFAPEALYIGVANVGGELPSSYARPLRGALEAGLDIVSGMHRFLGDDPELAALAAQHGAAIHDLRRVPEQLRVMDGTVYDLDVPRVAVMGMDCAIGKRVTAVELLRAAERRGLDPGFVATGQTGCMLLPHAGIVIDRIPGDFAAGMVEGMVVEVAGRGHSPIFIYGQASVRHPAFAGVALSILHGTAPHAIVLQVAPARSQRALFDHPRMVVGDVLEEIALLERLGQAPVVALAVNTAGCNDPVAACTELERRTGLPAVDPLTGDVDRLLDAALGKTTSAEHAWGRTTPARLATPSRPGPARD